MRAMVASLLLIAVSALSFAAEDPPPVWVELTFRESDQKIQYIFGTVPHNYMDLIQEPKTQFLKLSNVFFLTGDGPRRYKDDPPFEGVMVLRLANIVRVAPLKEEFIAKWKERLLAPPVPRAEGPVKPPKPPEEKF